MSFFLQTVRAEETPWAISVFVFWCGGVDGSGKVLLGRMVMLPQKASGILRDNMKPKQHEWMDRLVAVSQNLNTSTSHSY